MAIAIRGTPTTGTAINGSDITLSMPSGVVQNDVVIVGFALANVGGGGTSSSGWTQIGATVDNGTAVRIQVFRKVMGASPDASIVLTGSTDATFSSTACAIAFSGVSTTTPEDGVALTSATGSSTNPDPSSITPTTTGAVAVIYGATSLIDVTGTGAPAGYSDFAQNSSNDNKDTSSYIAWKGSLTGGVAENPGAFSGVSSAAWATYSVVLKPAGGNQSLAAGAGSYALTGTNATLRRNLPLVPDSGVYALTGANASLLHKYKPTAGAGSYTLTGTAAPTLHRWIIVAGAGSYALTGTNATLRKNLPLVAGAGSYALTGTNASLLHTWRPTAGAGSYALTGTNASTLHRWTLAAGAGSYALTGSDVTLTKTSVGAYSLAADAGSYVLTGTNASPLHTWKLTAGAGSYSLTGTAVTLTGTTTEVTSRGGIDPETEERRHVARDRRWKAARKSRDDLERMLQGLPPEPDGDALEAVEDKAVETANLISMMPELPLADLRAIDDLIRQIQALRVGDQIVRNELQAMVEISRHILRKKRDEDAILALLMMG